MMLHKEKKRQDPVWKGDRNLRGTQKTLYFLYLYESLWLQRITNMFLKYLDSYRGRPFFVETPPVSSRPVPRYHFRRHAALQIDTPEVLRGPQILEDLH